MFTSQHYIRIAETLARDPKLTPNTVTMFVEMFKQDNSRFDESKFRNFIIKRRMG